MNVVVVTSENQNLADLGTKLAEFPELTVEKFDITLFQNGSKKSSTLINNFDLASQIKSQSRWFSFDFKKSLYVKKVRVRSSGFDYFNDMAISYEEAFTKKTSEIKTRYNKEGNYFEFVVDAFIGGFGIQPEAKYYNNPKIIGVDVFGFDEKTFRRGLQFFDKIEIARDSILEECKAQIRLSDDAKTVLKNTEEKIAELELDVEEKTEEIKSIVAVIKNETENKDRVLNVNSALQITQKQLIDTKTALESDIETRKSTQSELSQQIAESEKKLRTLENDINLFPTEIAGYVTQGSKNIRTYILIGALPIIIITALTWRLIFNAEQLGCEPNSFC